MNIEQAFIELLSFCQREGVLSSTEDIYTELADLFDCEVEDIKELLD